jgi:hypothetical protein
MEENKYNFQKFTPAGDVDLKVYEDAINYIFDNPDIRNVAISGAYGAGKSSVISSYKKKYNKRRFIHISLAHFKLFDKADEIEVKESILEGKILNQLIHQIPSNKIPQTNFKIKRKIEPGNIAWNTVGVMLLIVSVLHIVFFSSWENYIVSLPDYWIKNVLSLSINKYSLILSGILCVIIFSIYLRTLINAQMNKNVLKKINLHGNEIEIFRESDESYFDKYLNEILYLFENAETNVVVFEDMDRFNVHRIFERLREINNLVNIQLKKEDKEPIRFFYLLRDDIFVSKERTKFFDYIIPIVPVVDSSNSYDQFISHFKEGGIFELFDRSFLQGLSLYIDDMRTLKNIYNEFIIYYYRLNTTELDCNRMLAMITYKNLFPRDFSNLQLNQGMVFTLFDKKDVFINEEIEQLKKRFSEKKSEIELMKKEHLNSQQELELVYNNKRAPYNRTLNQQDQTEYTQRKLAIENKLNKQLAKLEGDILSIENEIVLVQNKKIRDIITRENIDSIFKVTTKNDIGIETDFNEIKGNEYFALLKYLIWNGYIDETYADYMTYFYENSLSRTDKTFLRSITDKKAKEYTYQLKNPKLVVGRLCPVDFEQEEILNFSLLQYLLKDSSNIGFLNRFLDQLKQTANFEFVGAYFDTERELSAYVMNMNLRWPELFSCAIAEGALTDKQVRFYSIYTLYYSSDDSIQDINVDVCLTNYISNSADYLEISSPNIDKLIQRFMLLNISFVNINYDNADKALFDAVYQNSLYDINFENVALMLRKIYLFENESDIHHKNYSLVLTQPESPLANFIKRNICKYIDAVLSGCNGEISDDENVVLLILNDEIISVEQKNAYITFLHTPITSIIDVSTQDLWNVLLSHKLVRYSEENIMEYFKNSKLLDNKLISFINSDESKLDFSDEKGNYGKDKAEEFFDAVIVCNELSNQKYIEILTSLKFHYQEFDVDSITDEKLHILVDERIVRMNLDSLIFMREHYSNQVLYYIKKNINEYADVIKTEVFILDELIEILSWDVADDIKVRLLECTKERLSIINKGYSTTVNTYILKNNIETDDLPKLFLNYAEWDHAIQKIIYSLAINNIADIIAEHKNVSPELLKVLFVSEELNEDQKIDLFISLVPNLEKSLCKEYLDLLHLGEYKKLFDYNSKPRFEINIINQRLLTAFKDNGWIHDFQEAQERDYYDIISQPTIIKPLKAELI